MELWVLSDEASAERLPTELTRDGVAHHRRLLLSAQRRNLVHLPVESCRNLTSEGDGLRSQVALRLHGAREGSQHRLAIMVVQGLQGLRLP
jgi:hypothetical protein